jgi:uncharacterized membrane protein YvbJ
MSNCSKCGKEVQDSWKLCPYCGEVLNKTCPNCGKEVKSDWVNCPFCGTALNGDTTQSNKKKEPLFTFSEDTAI